MVYCSSSYLMRIIFYLGWIWFFDILGSFSKVYAFIVSSNSQHVNFSSFQVALRKRIIKKDYITFPKLKAHADKGVYVYDNVITSSCCEILHELAIDHSFRATNSDRSSVFPLKSPITPLEHSIASILSQFSNTKSGRDSDVTSEDLSKENDTDYFVEYWSRQEYINLDTHSDIDEEEFVEEGKLRCPDFGHVLYLQVDEDIVCPTIVFPDKLIGWENNRLLSCQQSGNCENDEMTSSTEKFMDHDICMITVPAVEGRLLRFDGRAMHAVPKPVNRWLMSSEEEDQIIVGEREGEENDEDDVLRSVLLFNIWSKTPQNVDPDPDTGELPDGIAVVDVGDAVDGNDNNHFLKQRISFWEEEYGTGFTDVLCRESSNWKHTPLQQQQENDVILQTKNNQILKARVRLMGEKSRRCYLSAVAKIISDSREQVESALKEHKTPSFLIFKEF